MAQFVVKPGDVLKVPSDLLLLKHAQDFYGADKAVADRLVGSGLCELSALRCAPGASVVIETRGSMAPERVMFLGTKPLPEFTYGEMRAFARRAVERLVDLEIPVRQLTTTVHGIGYGLDGGEALQQLIIGFWEGLARWHPGIERVTFLASGKRQAQWLATVLQSFKFDASKEEPEAEVPDEEYGFGSLETHAGPVGAPARALDTAPSGKRRVFVAMPFSDDFENVYAFALYPAVRECGLICERVDESHFTGEVLQQIKGGIEKASLVIADVTEARPNVYLEVGYAWGKGKPVIFVAKKGTEPHFDVRAHRCIYYGKFDQLTRDLTELIRGLGPTLP